MELYLAVVGEEQEEVELVVGVPATLSELHKEEPEEHLTLTREAVQVVDQIVGHINLQGRDIRQIEHHQDGEMVVVEAA